MILDYIAFGYVLYRIGVPLILSLPDPRKFEEKRIQRLMQHDIWVHAKRAVFDFLLIGAAFLVAWRHADLGILWLAFGIALVVLAVPTAFAWGSAGSRSSQTSLRPGSRNSSLIVSHGSADWGGPFKSR